MADERWSRRLVLAPGADVPTAVRILTDRHGPIEYTVRSEDDGEVLYWTVAR
jgi:hypothetical protein